MDISTLERQCHTGRTSHSFSVLDTFRFRENRSMRCVCCGVGMVLRSRALSHRQHESVFIDAAASTSSSGVACNLDRVPRYISCSTGEGSDAEREVSPCGIHFESRHLRVEVRFVWATMRVARTTMQDICGVEAVDPKVVFNVAKSELGDKFHRQCRRSGCFDESIDACVLRRQERWFDYEQNCEATRYSVSGPCNHVAKWYAVYVEWSLTTASNLVGVGRVYAKLSGRLGSLWDIPAAQERDTLDDTQCSRVVSLYLAGMIKRSTSMLHRFPKVCNKKPSHAIVSCSVIQSLQRLHSEFLK